MLYLLKHTEGNELFYLIKDREYIVGRKNTHIVISNDQSISRKHAVIKIVNDSVILTDCTSKYGTFHNRTKIGANTEITVNDKDIIKFGVYNSIYRLERLDVVTTGSGLTNEQKTDLKRKLVPIGGVLLSNWDDTCINVTAQEIMLTIKVLHSLIDNKPIVTLEYWDRFISNMNANKPPPNPDDFKPPVAESLIKRIKLSPNPERKSLFENKIFVFPNDKIKNKMSGLIEKTGGSSISWEKQALTMSQVSKSKNYLFITSDESKNVPPSLNEIYRHLTRVGERTIPIQEIAMAVVLCCCEKDCNPKFNRIHSVFMEQPIDSCSVMIPLASETPTEDMLSVDESTTKKELIIPESLDTDLQMITPSTSNEMPQPSAKRTEKESEDNPAKRIRLESREASTSRLSNTSFLDSQTKKRKADENIAPVSKKSTLKENPFAILRNKTPAKKTATDNPFAAMRITKEVKRNNDNPFKSPVDDSQNISKKSQQSVNSTPEKSVSSSSQSSFRKQSVNSTPEKSVSSLQSSFRKYSPSDISNITWIKDKSCAEKKEVDPEFKQTFEEFKNITIIEMLPSITRISFPSTFVSEGLDESSGKKNFKKFKKSKPRHLQTTIIQVVSRDSAKENNISIVIPSDDEEEEEEIRRPVVKKTTKNRFNF